MIKFDLDISYSQISIFNPNLENPFNDWKPQHVEQSFAWRKGSVSFSTLIESGKTEVHYKVVDTFEENKHSNVIIRVPFDVVDNKIEIASITESKNINVENGHYNIYFETGLSHSNHYWCSFSFVNEEDTKPQIIKSNQSETYHRYLLMNAEPA